MGACSLAMLILSARPHPSALAGTKSDSTGTIVGMVRDSCAREPLGGASAIVLRTRLTSWSDRNGWFRIAAVPLGRQYVKVACPWYQARLESIDVRRGVTDTLRFSLMPMRILHAEYDMFLMTHRDSCP
jgi:Carboxypeptidase regulatory-like domain